MTRHAQIRCQQRGIPPMVLDLLFQFGASVPAGDGATKMFFDKSARRKVQTYAGPLASLLNEHLNSYIVVGKDDEVITAAPLYERIRRH